MVRVISLCLAVVSCLVCVPVVRAHDLLGPAWRGQPGSTYQAWTFDSNANPVVVSNYFGNASASITVGPFGRAGATVCPGLERRRASGTWAAREDGSDLPSTTGHGRTATQRSGSR